MVKASGGEVLTIELTEDIRAQDNRQNNRKFLMAKAKTVFVCRNCGTEAPKWIGKCPSCGEWNTFIEEVVVKTSGAADSSLSAGSSVPVRLHEINTEASPGSIPKPVS